MQKYTTKYRLITTNSFSSLWNIGRCWYYIRDQKRNRKILYSKYTVFRVSRYFDRQDCSAVIIHHELSSIHYSTKHRDYGVVNLTMIDSRHTAQGNQPMQWFTLIVIVVLFVLCTLCYSLLATSVVVIASHINLTPSTLFLVLLSVPFEFFIIAVLALYSSVVCLHGLYFNYKPVLGWFVVICLVSTGSLALLAFIYPSAMESILKTTWWYRYDPITTLRHWFLSVKL